MRYYPIFLNLRGCPVVMIGGGAVAERKVNTLLKAGAEVTVISPSLTRRLAAWSVRGKIKEVRRPYRRGDLGRAVLAFTATDNREVNQAVAREAGKKKIFINVADQSSSEGFIVPALFTKKELTVAVSTGGKNPGMAKKIRDQLKSFFSSDKTLLMETQEKRRTLVAKGANKVPAKTASKEADRW